VAATGLRHRLATAVLALAMVPTRSASAAPPPARSTGLTVRVSPERVVLGGEAAPAVTIEVTVGEAGARAGLAGLRVDSTVGTVRGLTALGGGRFVATLEPPTERFPQIAVVSATDVAGSRPGEPPEVKVAVVAFAARLELKGATEPRARMIIEVGASRFGPVEAARDGRFALPIVVEPGQGWATGIATDPLGNTSRSRINLYLPEVQRLQAYVFPEALVADGEDTGWIWVTSLGPTGAPQQASVVAKAERGHIDAPRQLGPGLTCFAYHVPPTTDGADRVALSVEGWGRPTWVDLPLAAGPPTRLAGRGTPAPVPADGVTKTELRVEAFDRSGNPAAGHRVFVGLDDLIVPAAEEDPGVYAALLPPRSTAGRTRATVWLVPQSASCRRARALALAPNRLAVVDRRGVPCPGTLAALDAAGKPQWERTVTAGDERKGVEVPALPGPELLLVLVDADGVRRLVTPPAAGDARVEPAAALELPVELEWRVPAPVELGLVLVQRQGATARVRLTAAVERIEERVRLEAVGGTARVVGRGQGYVEYVVEGAGPMEVLATDRATGVGAWLHVD